MSLFNRRNLAKATSLLFLSCALPALAAPCNNLLPTGFAGFSLAPHQVTYKKKPKKAGAIANIGGVSYRMVRIPFIDYKTGNSYALVYPAEQLSQQLGGQIVVTFTTSHVKGAACNDMHIPGRPNTAQKLGVYETRNFNFTASEFSIGSSNRVMVMRQMIVPMAAQFNDTYVAVFLVARTKVEINKAVPTGKYDLEGQVNTNKLSRKPAPMLARLDSLVDLVYIEKL